MAHLAGKSGSVYIGNYLLSDCEVAWDSGTNGTAERETTIKKVGDASAQCTIGAGIQVGDVIMYDTMAAARNVSTYTHILCWAYSVPTTAAADYRIGLGTAAAGATPTTLVDVPALTATTWKYCRCTLSGGTFAATTAGTIIGLESNANGANGDIIYLDDIQAAKTIAGINTWSLDYTSDALESTDFASAGVKAYIVGGSGWSGSFAGYKEGIPLSIGEIYGVELAESATTTEMWLGNIIITGVHPSVASDGTVNYSYDFTGTGNLQVATT